MKCKKLIVILVSFIISCTVAYMIGQEVVLPLTHKNNIYKNDMVKNNTVKDDGNKDTKIEYSFADDFDNLSFEGKDDVDTSVIPWGSTIAKIEEEVVGTSIMMVQGTTLSTKYHVNENESIQWNYSIHPWVSELSDGMSLYVTAYVVGGEPARFRKKYIVNPEDDYIFESISLNEFVNQDITIYFSTDNGANGNSDGDWLVLNALSIVSDIK